MDSGESSEEEMTEDAAGVRCGRAGGHFGPVQSSLLGRDRKKSGGGSNGLKIWSMEIFGTCSAIGAKGLPQYTAGSDGSAFGSAGTGQTDENNLVTRVLTGEYCAMHFRHYESETETGEKEWPDGIQYEMEYLLGGQGSDRENLASAVRQILVLREGFNLISLLVDSTKKGGSQNTGTGDHRSIRADAVCGDYSTLFIMTIWALAESVADVRILLAGGKVPLAKSREDWQRAWIRCWSLEEDQTFPGQKNGDRDFLMKAI